MSLVRRSPRFSHQQEPAPSETPAVSPDVIGELFRSHKVKFSDYAAVIADLRKAGEKPNLQTIHSGLQELSSPSGREQRQQRNSVNESKIVRLPTAQVDPQADALALRVQTYESQLEEAQREIAQSRHLRSDLENLQRQLERARKREESLNEKLRQIEATAQEGTALREEIHRQKTQIYQAQQKEEALRAELKCLQESASTPDADRAKTPSNVVSLDVRPVISERELLLTNELEAALAAVERAEMDTREVADLRRILEEEQSLRQAIETRWMSSQERVERVRVLELELSDLKVNFNELLQRERTLQSQYEAVSDRATYLDDVAGEAERLEGQLAEARQCEEKLSRQLEEASRRAALATELEDQVTNLQSILSDFRQRERQWSSQVDHLQQTETAAVSLRTQLSDASRALSASQSRERGAIAQMDDLRRQLSQGVSAYRVRELESQLQLQTESLNLAKSELQSQTALVGEIQVQLAQAEALVADLQTREVPSSPEIQGESDLALRLEEACQRAAMAEQELAQNTELMEWGRSRTEQIQQQLLDARSALARLYPDAVSQDDPASPEMDEDSSFAASFHVLEALLGQLHRELEQAQQYKQFLQGELDKAQPVATERSSTSGVTIESVELRKCLAETIEIELSRQNHALSELTRREELLRSQLEKIKPQSVQAQSIQGQLTSQGAYREDLLRRETALTQLLRETLTSLRAGAVK